MPRETLNKWLRGLATLLVLAGGLPSWAMAASDQARTFRIDMLLYRGCEEACQSFQTQLGKLGIRADYRLLDAKQDKEKLRANVALAKAARPDLIVAWGTSVALETVGAYDATDTTRQVTDIPVLFMIVSDPLAAKIVKSFEAPGRNVTGVRYLLPLEAQLRAARAYLDFKRVGIVLNRAEANSLITRDQLKALANTFGFQLIEREVPRDEAGRPDAAALPRLVAELAAEKVDLIYQIPDSFLNVNSDALTGAAVAMGIPVFAAAEAPVLKSSALFGVTIKYQDVGRHTAYLAEKILIEGKRPKDIPVVLPRHFSYLVNMRVAAQLNRYPPLKLLDVAELTPAPPAP